MKAVQFLDLGPGLERPRPSARSLALTGARLPLGAGIVFAIAGDAYRLAAVLTVLFMAWDVVDGVISRRFDGGETAARRALDAGLDKATVHVSAMVMCWHVPGLVVFWMPLLVRDVIQASINVYASRELGQVVGGAPWHRAFSVSLGFWGLSLLLTERVSVAWSLLALAAGVATLWDYGRQVLARVAIRGRRPSASAALREAS